MTVSLRRRLAATSLTALLLTLNPAPLESAPKKAVVKKAVVKKAAATKKPALAKKSPAAAKKTVGRRPVARVAVRPAPVRRIIPATTPAAVGVSLEERLASLVNGPTSRSSDAGISIVEVASGRVVAERNPNVPLTPASNMKLFTTAAALDILPTDFELITTVAMRGDVDATGTLAGDVKVVGRGDATIGSRFHDGDATAVLQNWAAELQRAGVKTIAGDLIFEYGYMDTEYIHPSWPADQLLNWYEAPISAFSMQEGCVMVRVLPTQPGQRANVAMEPQNSYLSVQNNCTTGRGYPLVTRRPGTNNIIINGGVPPRSGASEIFITIVNPVHYFANVTKEAFLRSGIRILGQVRLSNSDDRPDWKTVTEHKTPLAIMIYVINKKSQNHYAEQLLKVIGAEVNKKGSWQSGGAAITDWLRKKVGINGQYMQADGSGMSRFNRATAGDFTKLLLYMWKTPHRNDFLSSMPYTGDPDSKFGKRLKNPPYARQVYAKTGYIGGVVGLSGYVHGQSGKVYAFSFLFNRYHTGVFNVYRLHDEMLKEIVRGG
ncbi:MAG TPA: D-alanyl-D-alanine carboxypeptidase/D-alanyl-D-alanine-endopeptidase [Thermoanaerobaculia bacterium]|nr:D-alanyl-D-alanine carboxypeptidase/D-alanyl-D-alanine-endopeptidase [Thermoanaerobaculia bacterium]